MGRLQNKITIVTGAARGIGRAVTRAFAAEGATVFAVDIIAADLAEVMAELDAEGLAAYPLVADIALADDVERIAAEAMATGGRIDCLANIAGVISYQLIEQTSLDEWDRILGINLRGTFLCTRAVVPTMKRQRSGSIINVSSRAGVMGFTELSAYCAAKFGGRGSEPGAGARTGAVRHRRQHHHARHTGPHRHERGDLPAGQTQGLAGPRGHRARFRPSRGSNRRWLGTNKPSTPGT